MGILTRAALFAAALLLLGAPAAVTAPAGGAVGEAQAKAALLYNFATFVDWPPAPPSGNPAALVIGVAGDAAVLEALGPLQGTKIGARTIVAREVQPDDDPRACQVLFLASPDDRATTALMGRIGEAPVLTVGDSDGFTDIGGIVRVYFEHGRLRFEISRRNAQRARLHISAKLLGLARVVTE
jgi:hypothetical protein